MSVHWRVDGQAIVSKRAPSSFNWAPRITPTVGKRDDNIMLCDSDYLIENRVHIVQMLKDVDT